MADEEQDDFGKGVFAETVAVANDAQETESEEPIVLTDREIAIAEGNDPDNPQSEAQAQGNEDAERSEQAEEDDEQAAPELVAETKGDKQDEEAESDSDGDEPWFNQSDLRLAKTYNLNDEDLTELGSASAFHRAIDVIDRQGEKTGDASSGGEAGGETDTEDAAEVKETPDLLSQLPKLEAIDISKYSDYDPEDQELVNHIAATQAAVAKQNEMITELVNAVGGYQNQQVESSQREAAQKFESTLDSHPAIYGKSGDKLTEDNKAARDQVQEQAETIYQGLVARKATVPPLEQIFEQAMRSVHGDKLPKGKAKPEERRAALEKQSKKRRSPGKKAAATRKTAVDSEDPNIIASDPELTEMFNEFQVANGVL